MDAANENPQLRSYINTMRSQGKSDSEIKNALLAAGWNKAVVDVYFKQKKPNTNLFLPLILLIFGLLILIISFFVTYMSGQTVFTSTKKPFTTSSSDPMSFAMKDNPYRTILNVNFTKIGTLITSKNRLFDYQLDVTDKDSNSVISVKQPFDYQSNSTNSSSKENVSTTIALPDFKVIHDGEYTVSLVILPNLSMDRNIALDTYSYSMKNQVRTVSPAVPFIGAIFTFCAVVWTLILLKKK